MFGVNVDPTANTNPLLSLTSSAGNVPKAGEDGKIDYSWFPFSIATPQDFGAKGDGVTDDTAAFLDAFNPTGSPSRATTAVFVPPGEYKINSLTLPINAFIYGVPGLSRIYPTGSSDTFVVPSSAPYYSQTVIKDLTFTNHAVGAALNGRTAGSYITAQGNNLVISNVFFEDAYKAIYLNGCNGTYIENCSIIDCSSTGMGFHLVNAVDSFISNCLVSMSNPVAGGYKWGFYIEGHSSAVYIDTVDVIAATSGLVVSPMTGFVSFIFADKLLCDTCSQDGIYLNPTSLGGNYGKIIGAEFTNCWSSSCGYSGFKIGGASTSNIVDGIHLIGHKSYGNGRHGYNILGGTGATASNIEFNSCQATGNNTLGGTYDGLNIGASVNNFRVIGGRYGGPSVNLTDAQRYGIYVADGCDKYIITAADATGNVTGQIKQGNGSTKSVTGNLGTVS